MIEMLKKYKWYIYGSCVVGTGAAYAMIYGFSKIINIYDNSNFKKKYDEKSSLKRKTTV